MRNPQSVALARTFADNGDVNTAELIRGASLAEAIGDFDEAWCMREAVAIRVVDHPNEPRKEVDGGG